MGRQNTGSIREHRIQRKGKNGQLLRSFDIHYEARISLPPLPGESQRRDYSATFASRDEAAAQIIQWQSQQDSLTGRQRVTVSQMFNLWLDSKSHLKAKTLEGYRATITHHILPILGDLRIQDISARTIAEFYTTKRKKQTGTRTMELIHLRLSQMLEYAGKLHIISSNPAVDLGPRPSQRRPLETWSEEEIRKFLAVETQGAYFPIWSLYLASGCRRGELLGLHWDDVLWEHNAIRIKHSLVKRSDGTVLELSTTKNNRARIVYLPDHVMHLLRQRQIIQNQQREKLGERYIDNGLVFASSVGTPIYPDNLRRDVQRLSQLAAIKRLTIHEFRHTMATRALAHNAPLAGVSEQLGHSDVSITSRIYLHSDREQQQRVAESIRMVLAPAGESTREDLLAPR